MNYQNENSVEQPIKVKSETLGSLAKLYNCNIKTFKKWIIPIHKKLDTFNTKDKKRYLLTPREVKYIYDFLGEP